MLRADGWPVVPAPSANRLFVVGLTGGIGSGKSTAATFLDKLGAVVIDADLIAHRLTSPQGDAINAIRLVFGDATIGGDGALNRKMMRAMAFSDPLVRTRLETILHPLIRAEINCQLRALEVARTNASLGGVLVRSLPNYAVIVLPLLFETGSYTPMLDRILVIDCPESRQIRQVIHRAALAVDEIRRIMASQVPRAVRLQRADDVVCNVASPETLCIAMRAVHDRYCRYATDGVSGAELS